MLKVRICTYNPKNTVGEFDVLVLCKGLNSGKPLNTPCPNCFVIVCKSQDENDFYRTLLFGLWKIKHFQAFLVGSVIPFLRIEDFKQQVSLQAEKMSIKNDDFKADVEKVKLIEAKERQYYQQMLLLSDVKRALLYRHFKSRY